MSIFKLFAAGLVLTFRKRRLVLRLWAVNFLFAVLVAAPAAFLLIGHSAHSLSAAAVLKKLDVHWLTDLSVRYLDAAPAYAGLLVLAVGLYMLLAVFLNGGIIGCLARPESRPTLADFFHDCGLNFWPFFRLFLLSIPVYLLALALFFPLLRVLLEALQRRAATEWPVLIAGNIRILSLVLLLGLVSMFFDYVKIGLATGGRSSVLKESWLTLKFLWRRFFRAWALYLSGRPGLHPADAALPGGRTPSAQGPPAARPGLFRVATVVRPRPPGEPSAVLRHRARVREGISRRKGLRRQTLDVSG